jgi:hypothetical protein
MAPEKDAQLWRMAQQRAGFKKSLFTYITVIAFLWAIWWITTGKKGMGGTPWPVWVMLGWGIGIAFQYFKAYNGDKETLAEQEYEKLKNNGQ